VAFPTIRQQAAGQSTTTFPAPNATTFTLGSAAVAGNQLVLCFAGDKNTGALTVTDNIGGTWQVTDPNGVTITGASVSLYIARKVATGGETTITATVGTAQTGGYTGLALELAETGTGAWTVCAKAVPAYSDTSRSSASSGTSDTADYDGLGIAVGAIDSMSSIGSEAQRTAPTFSNGYAKPSSYNPVWPPSSGGGSGGCYVATAQVAQGATTSTTFATNGGSDQLTCAILVLGRAASTATAPTVSAGADVSVPVGTLWSRTATEDDNGSAVTARGWQIVSGPADVGASNTSQGVSYTPTVAGTYVFRYSATNAGGTSTDDVTVTATTVTPVALSSTIPAVVADAYTNRTSSSGDEAYDVPTTAQAATLAGAYSKLMAGDDNGAAADVDPLGYEVVQLTDTATGRSHVLLRERTPATRYWGLYVWSRDAARTPMVIEAPHPKADLHTHTEAGALFDKANAKAFLLSTAHRNSNVAVDGGGNRVSDLANYTGINPFQAVHEVAAATGSTVVQIHGYADATDPDYDIIVSEGATPAAARTLELAQDLRDSPGAFRVGVYDGTIGVALGATGNVQGQQSRTAGVYWVHLEQNSTLRGSATSRGYVEDVLALGIPEPASAPVDVIPFGTAAGLVHYAFDIGQEAGGGRTLYSPTQLAAGLQFDPEFLAVTDATGNWVQAAVREDATTTSGSTNPRSEGRETAQGSDSNLGFTPTSGTHWQRIRARVMEHPTTVENAGVSIAQVHSLGDDIMMVRTRVRANGTMDLVLREYDPGTGNSVDVLTLRTGYQFGDIVDVLFLMRDGRAYVFLDDFLIPVHRTDPALWPVTGTYMQKWGTYSQNTAAWPAGTWGRAHFRNAAHFHTGWAAPANYFGCPEVVPSASASPTVGEPVTLSATETGSGITARKWAILEGPTGVGTSLGTTATLEWTPAAAGDYVLMYGAQNAEGWSNPTFLTVAVAPASGGGAGGGVRSRLAGKAAAATTHLPSDKAVGDRVFVGFCNDHADASAAASTGWTSLGSMSQGTTTNHSLTVFTRVLDGTSADNLTVTITDANHANSVAAAWVAVCLNGDGGGTPQAMLNNGGGALTGTVGAVTGLTSGDYDSIVFLGLDNSTAVAQTVTPPTDWGNLTAAGVSADPVYAYSMDRQLLGVTGVSPGNVNWTGTEQWITAHVVSLAITAVAPTVSAGPDAIIDQYEPLNITATENDGGAPITSRAWTVVSGPNQVGATLATTAALTWAPTVGGTYVLRYSASNSQGTGTDDVTVTVDPLNFPVTASLRLSATVTGRKHITAPVGAVLALAATVAGRKQAVAAPTAQLRLTGSVTGKKINLVRGVLRLYATIETASSTGAHVTARMRLSAALAAAYRATAAVPVAAQLGLSAQLQARSDRDGGTVAAEPVRLSADMTGRKLVSSSPHPVLRLTANVSFAELVAQLRLTATLSDRFHTSGSDVTATLVLSATPATRSVRYNHAVSALLRLHGDVIGSRILTALRKVTPRADNTVRYDLVGVARIPQASGPPIFIEVDPIDWKDLTWTESLNAPPTLSASAKIDTLTEPILQRLRSPHALPTELWLYRNGRKVFAGPLLGGRASNDALTIEGAGIETYTRWMHVAADLSFTDVDQFAIAASLINQWQALEYGHFGIDTGTEIVTTPPPAERDAPHVVGARPAGTVAGDVLIAAHICDNDGSLSQMSGPSGWTLLGQYDHGSSQTPRLKIWGKIATASEPTSYTFPDSTDAHSAVGIVRITGQDPAGAVVVSPVFAGSSSSSNYHTAPSVNGVPGGLLVTVHAGETSGTTRSYFGSPQDMTERVDVAPSDTGQIVLGMYTQELTAATSTGAKTAICTGSVEWVAASLVIAPAPVTAPPTTTVSGPTSGVLRSIAYPAAELHVVSDRLDDLTKMADGFDWNIDPTTRKLQMHHPARGVDRSTGEDAIVFDARNITSSDIAFSIAPADLASDGLAVGTASGSDAPLVATWANEELRAQFGRTGITASFQADDQAALDSGVQALVNARGEVLLIPGPSARVTLDADLGSYDIGDLIGYHAHARLTRSGAFRIRKRSVRVTETNTEAVSVEFV
jgi:hypothetical protein